MASKRCFFNKNFIAYVFDYKILFYFNNINIIRQEFKNQDESQEDRFKKLEGQTQGDKMQH